MQYAMEMEMERNKKTDYCMYMCTDYGLWTMEVEEKRKMFISEDKRSPPEISFPIFTFLIFSSLVLKMEVINKYSWQTRNKQTHLLIFRLMSRHTTGILSTGKLAWLRPVSSLLNPGVGICNTRTQNPDSRRVFAEIAQLLSIIPKIIPFLAFF